MTDQPGTPDLTSSFDEYNDDFSEEDFRSNFILTGRGQGTPAEPGGWAMAHPRKQWEDETQTWQEATAELRDHAKKIIEHSTPPTNGEIWDDLIKSYVEMRKLLETVTREAIGIDITYGSARVTQLSRDVGLTQAHVSNQKKKWIEHHRPEN